MTAFHHEILAVLLAASVAACGAETEDSVDELAPVGPDGTEAVPAAYEPYAPRVEPALLSSAIENPWLPFPVGASWAFEATVDGVVERIEIVVEEATRDVWGATARVVRDTAYVDGEMVEDTHDWYGEDPDGNVWYLGEDTAEYEDGEVSSTEGSWESGVDGALPGVAMLGRPSVGARYRQEYFAGEAEDYAVVVDLDVSVSVPAGDFEGCVRTHDLSVIDPELDEMKTYCPGVGNVLVEEGDVREELVEYAGLD